MTMHSSPVQEGCACKTAGKPWVWTAAFLGSRLRDSRLRVQGGSGHLRWQSQWRWRAVAAAVLARAVAVIVAAGVVKATPRSLSQCGISAQRHVPSAPDVLGSAGFSMKPQ